MKIVIGLNKNGRKSAEAFLAKYDEGAQIHALYDMEFAVDLISREISKNENQSYELRSHESVTGNPITISFSDDELEFIELEE